MEELEFNCDIELFKGQDTESKYLVTLRKTDKGKFYAAFVSVKNGISCFEADIYEDCSRNRAIFQNEINKSFLYLAKKNHADLYDQYTKLDKEEFAANISKGGIGLSKASAYAAALLTPYFAHNIEKNEFLYIPLTLAGIFFIAKGCLSASREKGVNDQLVRVRKRKDDFVSSNLSTVTTKKTGD